VHRRGAAGGRPSGRVRTAFLAAAVWALVAAGAAAAGAGPSRPPADAVAAVAGTGRPVTVGYRSFLAMADAHRIRAAALGRSGSWVVGRARDGRVLAARLPTAAPMFATSPAGSDLPARLRADGVPLVEKPLGAGQSVLPLLLCVLGPLALLGGGGLLLARRRRAAGGRRRGLGASPRGLPMALGGHGRVRGDARVEAPPVRFSDVAGCDEVVVELREVVDFLRDPKRVMRLGGRMPRGVILHGPPGTGKTLLAKATAGEAGVPFFSVSGSEFVDTYVGVGASRVRDLFARARAKGGVVFIDEIDAAGRARGAGPASGASDEREATLNQLLVEMDGMASGSNVLVMAATNRLDLLDRALLRPGRFDRHIRVGLPGRDGRLAILRLHARGKPLADPEDLERLAARSGGAAGADLANILNEAALLAARAGGEAISACDLDEAQLRHFAGPQRAERLLSESERRWVAAHEAGHCLAAELCPSHAKAEKVTILARGETLGLAFYGDSDHYLDTPEELRGRMIVAMAGRAAEQVVLGRMGAGAANDLEKANAMARQAVETLGFSARVGQITTHVGGQAVALAEGTRRLIDEEVARLVDEAYREAMALLADHRPALDALAAALVAEEQIDRARIERILGEVAAPERRAQSTRPRALPAEPPPAAGHAKGASRPAPPGPVPVPEWRSPPPRRRTRRPAAAGAAALVLRLLAQSPSRRIT